MIGRRISFSLLLGLSLLAGCARNDQPTIRQVSLRPEEGLVATGVPNPPGVEVACPGAASHHKADPKRDFKPDATRVQATLARLATPAPAGNVAATPAKVAEPADIERCEVRLGNMRLVSPRTWTREPSAIGFILASFRLPRAQGDQADAQLTVAAAGSTDMKNIQHLRQQLAQQPQGGSVEHLKIGDGEVVLVESSSDSSDASGPAPAPANEGRFRALTATVFVGGKAYFITCTGPEKTVGERAGEFRGFLQSMKSVN